jgi:hypothetical protein
VLLRIHLFVCIYCVRYGQQLLFVRDAMRHYSAQIEDDALASILPLPIEAAARIKLALRSQVH